MFKIHLAFCIILTLLVQIQIILSFPQNSGQIGREEGILSETSWLVSIFSKNGSDGQQGWIFIRAGAIISTQKILFAGNLNFDQPIENYIIVLGLSEYTEGQDFPPDTKKHKVKFLVYPDESKMLALAYLEIPLDISGAHYENIEIDFYSKSFYYWNYIENNTIQDKNLVNMNILQDIPETEAMVAGFSKNGSKFELLRFNTTNSSHVNSNGANEDNDEEICLLNGNFYLFKVSPNVSNWFLLILMNSNEEMDEPYCLKPGTKKLSEGVSEDNWVILRPNISISQYFWDSYRCGERFFCTGMCLPDELICDNKINCPTGLEENEEYCSQNLNFGGESSKIQNFYFYIAIIGMVLGAITLSLLKIRIQNRKIPPDVIHEFLEGDKSKISHDIFMTFPYDKRYEIDPNLLIKDESRILGSGSNGTVFEGRLVKSQKEQNYFRKVAIKSLNPDSDVNTVRCMLREIKTHIYLGDFQFIVKFYGAITSNIHQGDISIVVENCENGSLEKFLRKNRNQNLEEQTLGYVVTQKDDFLITKKLMLKWAFEISQGMEYLERKKVIHADLASRNVLLDNSYVAKLSDFGLSRKLYTCPNYIVNKEEMLPWRHMPVESLKDLEFSSKSDVWSFGVTLWEIFSFAQIPYEVGTPFTQEFITRLENGLRLDKWPDFTPDFIIYLANECWKNELNDRPQFRDIVLFFKNVFENQ